MRYQNRYPKTMSRKEIRLLNSWFDPIDGLSMNGGRGIRISPRSRGDEKSDSSPRVAMKNKRNGT